MKSFKAYFMKEMMEGVRNYKYSVLAAGIFTFAVLDPLMLKLLPAILRSQNILYISDLIKITQQSAIQNYMKDLFQISFIVVVLSLMGILSEEINKKNLVIPYTKGVSAEGMVWAKTIHYSIVITIMIFLGFAINYYYTGILFKEETVTFSRVMRSSFLFSIYFIFTISLVTFLSGMFKRGVVAVMITFTIAFVMPVLYNFSPIMKYLPYHLIYKGVSFPTALDRNIWVSVISTLIYVVMFNFGAIYRMKHVEVT